VQGSLLSESLPRDGDSIVTAPCVLPGSLLDSALLSWRRRQPKFRGSQYFRRDSLDVSCVSKDFVSLDLFCSAFLSAAGELYGLRGNAIYVIQTGWQQLASFGLLRFS
jgi:hypothetical protein